MISVYIGIGSNLGNPRQQIRRAIQALHKLPGSEFIRVSSLYQSKPMGPAEQPDYINAVAEVHTSLSAHDVLDQLQRIEQQQGRVRGTQRWGPRTLDLDLLLYGEQTLNDERLTVPHAGLGDRNFVLYPLRDIAPAELNIPGQGGLEHLITQCSAAGLEKITT